MSLRFGFLPAGLCGTAGDLLALLRGELVSTGLTALLPAKLAEFDLRRVFPFGLELGQYAFPSVHVHDELRKLIDVSRAFTFWHKRYYAMSMRDILPQRGRRVWS
jgi:hypothetical protein